MSQLESGTLRAIISATIMLATILQALDSTIAAVALPDMQGTFSATQDQVAWVLTSYIVAAAIMTPMAGYLGDRLGRKQLYLIAVCWIHPDVDGVRPRNVDRTDGAVPLPARVLRRAARSARASDHARHVSAQSDRRRDGDVRHGRDARTDPGSESRRVSHGVLQLALGVLHQRAARRNRVARHSGDHQGSTARAIATGRSTSAASRCSASPSDRCS